MGDFLTSTLAKCLGAILAAIALLILGSVGSSVAKTYFPSTEYVNQQVNTSHEKVMVLMKSENDQSRAEFKEQIEDIAEEFKIINGSLASEISKTTEEFTSAIKEINAVQAEINVDKAVMGEQIEFLSKEVHKEDLEIQILEERVRFIENERGNIR